MLILTVVVSKKIYKAFVLVIALLLAFVFSGCEGNIEIDPYGEYDTITKSLAFNVPVTETSSFLTDGAGYATVITLTDGDTTTFKITGDQTVTIRYYCVDTPESTGGVEKWGKAASKFVKERLSKATSIVLEATSTPAKHDSYGSRYLGYVWYKINEGDNYKLLNLELVENGFTPNKAINTPDFKYYSEFKKAEDFAKGNALRVHGNYEDPLYSTAASKITIKDFWDNVDEYYNKEADSGAKVRIQAYISDLTISSTGTYTFTATQKIDGKYYDIAVYTGYSSSLASTYMTIGDLFSITGTIQLYNQQYQISGVTYVAMQSGGDYLTTLQSNYYCTFNSSIEYAGKWGTSLFSDVTVQSATVENGELTITGSTSQRGANGNKDAEIYTFKLPVSSEFDVTKLDGKVISVAGIQEVKKSKVIAVDDINKIVIR